MLGLQEHWLQRNSRWLLDALADAVVVVDKRGHLCYLNSAATSMFGFTIEEWMQQPLSMMMPIAHRAEQQAYIERYLASDEPLAQGSRSQLFVQAKDGRQFPTTLELTAVEGTQDACFVGLIRELGEPSTQDSQLIEQRKRFAQINRLSTLGEMTANIAHEINQPLAAIALYAQASRRLLERDGADKAKLLEALDKLNAQTLRVGAVIERIQNFVRSDTGERQRASINQILEEVHPLMAADVQPSGILLELNKAKTSPVVVCDALQIQQVLINLVRNAADAMLEVNCRYGSVISINCDDKTAGVVVVSVVDSGAGIDEAIQSVMFDAFQTSKTAGTGMGLSVSRSLIEQHEGALSCTNNSGWGATFSFKLPAENSNES